MHGDGHKSLLDGLESVIKYSSQMERNERNTDLDIRHPVVY
jgi:hypothetical protein